MTALSTMLSIDVSLHSDGGGKRPAALRLLIGVEDVMKVQRSLVRFFEKGGWPLVQTAIVNGLPGFITREADGELQTTALDIEDDKVTAIYVMRNPEKLRHLH